jgi:hypothetical protein
VDLPEGIVMEVEHLAARYNAATDKFEVANRVTDDDGNTIMALHIFPPETLEWRSAEYGIDPEDTDTLLDIVLSEPYDNDEPPLWNVETRDEARAALADRLQARKQKMAVKQARRAGLSNADLLREAGVPQEYIDAAEEEPRAFLKRAARVNPEVVDMLAKHVDKQREKIKAEKEKHNKAELRRALDTDIPMPADSKDRVQRLRRQLSIRSEHERHNNN